MELEDLRRDWTASNALLLFVGALLMGTVWEPSDGTYTIFFVFTVPSYSSYVTLSIVFVLLLLSVSLAVATFSEPVRSRALLLRDSLSPLLNALVWLSFTLSWATAHDELPLDQWWSMLLLLVGMLFSLLFWPLRVMRSKKNRR